jgi:hypothetical protein
VAAELFEDLSKTCGDAEAAGFCGIAFIAFACPASCKQSAIFVECYSVADYEKEHDALLLTLRGMRCNDAGTSAACIAQPSVALACPHTCAAHASVPRENSTSTTSTSTTIDALVVTPVTAPVTTEAPPLPTITTAASVGTAAPSNVCTSLSGAKACNKGPSCKWVNSLKTCTALAPPATTHATTVVPDQAQVVALLETIYLLSCNTLTVDECVLLQANRPYNKHKSRKKYCKINKKGTKCLGRLNRKYTNQNQT